MDFITIMTISTLLLVITGSDQTTRGPDVRETSFPTKTYNTSKDCSCPGAASAATVAPTVSPSSSTPALGFLTIRWTSECEGDIILIPYHPSSSSSPVCHNSETHVQTLFSNVCQNKKGCKGTPQWDKGKQKLSGYCFKENGAKETSCKTLQIQCTVEALADVQGQLKAYKVVTALLCCVLLVLLLMCFTRPTIKVLQKRLSDRRQNRWIGPTQSHSVSYHRGKTAVKNNDGEKRLSYPALERLAVSDSREPSSNRNSDYNF
ncbi:CD5 molecule [Chaetodon auriga]|uniref:CD5 molecule n=1 Tax=Chaetodon auriga TaxID=39042 RepID=UPI004032F0B4